MKLSGKTTIITVAGAGIDEATSILFAQNGANVVVADISDSGLNVTRKIQSLGSESIFIEGDVSELEMDR
ncbi:MAG: hypothetical protein AM326_04955 [Candidatus Thorarchaeota archaeon SMTZ-45]|nr:MAG: hypothetical protein AM326_04955 [Candidatus Thorarchaeota archaeon SMTZ-45]KXH71733.1 MAG: hypothetical protein AM325_02545 [Candidatus Thorarchaeota archaeon SMTZ1-45]